jgi:MraZ protein
MFRGNYLHNIDSKGRLSVPNRFRDVLKAKDDNRLVVTRGTHEHCLSVFAMDRWMQVEQDVDNLPAGRSKDDFVRHFISPAQDVSMDKMGRILIPAQLRDEAGLDREVMVVGALSKFEIWDRDKWDAYTSQTRDNALGLLDSENIRF